MLRSTVVFGCVAGLAGLVCLSGCGKPGTAPASADRKIESSDTARTAGTEDGANNEESANNEIPEGLAKLDAADRELALAQRVCPVSDEPLGSMAAPVKMTVEGKTFFLCCAGCKGAVADDPDAVLAKLAK